MNNIEKTIWSEKVIQTLDSGILVFDYKSYRLIMINDEAKRIFDCADADSSKIMHIIASMLPEEELVQIRRTISLLRETGKSSVGVCHAERKDGSRLTVKYSIKLRESDDGGRYIICNLIDMTEESRLSAELSMERRQYRDALLANARYSYRMDLNDGMIKERFVTSDGNDPFEIMGLTVPIFFDDFNKAFMKQFDIRLTSTTGVLAWTCEGLINEFNSGKNNVESEYYIPQRDKYYRTNALMFRNDTNGHIIAIIIGTDVTVQQRTMEINREAFTLMRDMFYKILCVDLSADRVYNIKVPVFEQQEEKNYPKQYTKLAELWAEKYVHPDDKAKFISLSAPAYLENAFKEKSTVSFTYHRQLGDRYKWMQADLVPMSGYCRYNSRFVWYVRDIDDDKAKERDYSDRLRQANAELQAAYESAERLNKSLELLRDIYYRISYIDLSVNKILPIKVTTGEQDDINKLGENFDEAAFFITTKYVLREYRDQVIKALDARNLMRQLAGGNGVYSITYERYTDSGIQWVRSEFIPIQPFTEENARIIWYVKNISEERSKEIKAQQELEKAYVAAEQASRAKSLFLSNMSHDIRTPMNAIINMTRFMREDINDPDKLREDLAKVESSGNFLLSLINDILDMAKIESGEMVLRPEVFTYEEFITTLKNVFEPLAQSKGIKLEIRHDSEPVSIWVDKVRFYQIFYNLLSNAIKYTPSGGTVVYEEKNKRKENGFMTCDFYIIDNGIGMSKEFQKKMFEPFEREGNNNNGTGLGLSIVKNIVDLMNGRITVVSEPGMGTTFCVHLSVPAATEEQILVSEEKTTAEDAASAVKGLRILVVEDNELNQEIIRRLLEDVGVTVEVADNGKNGVDMYLSKGAFYYDAVFMDLQMPVMNGLDASKAIRSSGREDSKIIPIIAMTANAFSEDKDAARQAGMNDHLSKPVDIRKIIRVLNTEVGRARGMHRK